MIIVSLGLAGVHALQGDFPSAIQTLDRTLGLARAWAIGALIPLGEVYRGSVLAV